MERRDVLIAAAGAAVLVLALAGVALTGAGEDAPHAVTFATQEASETLDAAALQPGSTTRIPFALEVDNLSEVRVLLAFSAPVFPAGTDWHARLLAPNGTEVAMAEGRLPLGGSSDAVEVWAPVAAQPQDRTLPRDEAEAALASAASTEGRGEWVLEVSYMPDAPAPLEAQATFSWTTWSGSHAPVPPATR